MKNETIKAAIQRAGLKQWEVADALDVHENTLLRLLRHELTDEQRRRVEEAIEQAKANKEGRT